MRRKEKQNRTLAWFSLGRRESFRFSFLWVVILCLMMGQGMRGEEQEWERLLREAEATMRQTTMIFRQRIGLGNAPSKTKTGVLVWQKGAADGTVQRRMQIAEGASQPEALRGGQILFRTYYNDQGRTEVIFLRDKCWGVRVPAAIPRFFPETPARFSGKESLFQGYPCWEITRHYQDKNGNAQRDVYQVDRKHRVIRQMRSFNAQGMATFACTYEDFDFHPAFPPELFQLPQDLQLSLAKNEEEFTKKRSQVMEEVAKELNRREKGQRNLPSLSWPERWIKRMRNSPARLALLCLTLGALLFLGMGVALKGRTKK